MTSPSAIVCRQLTKQFGHGSTAVEALRGIDLEVKQGELLMLLGPSGSGKTTLISIMSGILNPTAGQCQVLGEEIHTLSSQALTAFRGRFLGFVFQAYNLIPMLSLLENVAIPLLIHGVPRKEAERRAAELLERVGLGERMDAQPTAISGGQAQRVAIARAMAHQPRLIFCDEPTSALDAHTGHEIMELFRGLVTQEQVTLVLVTHDARILNFADRIASMEDGHISSVEAGAAASN